MRHMLDRCEASLSEAQQLVSIGALMVMKERVVA